MFFIKAGVILAWGGW